MNTGFLEQFKKVEWYEFKDLSTPYDLESIMVC